MRNSRWWRRTILLAFCGIMLFGAFCARGGGRIVAEDVYEGKFRKYYFYIREVRRERDRSPSLEVALKYTSTSTNAMKAFDHDGDGIFDEVRTDYAYFGVPAVERMRASYLLYKVLHHFYKKEYLVSSRRPKKAG